MRRLSFLPALLFLACSIPLAAAEHRIEVLDAPVPADAVSAEIAGRLSPTGISVATLLADDPGAVRVSVKCSGTACDWIKAQIDSTSMDTVTKAMTDVAQAAAGAPGTGG